MDFEWGLDGLNKVERDNIIGLNVGNIGIEASAGVFIGEKASLGSSQPNVGRLGMRQFGSGGDGVIGVWRLTVNEKDDWIWPWNCSRVLKRRSGDLRWFRRGHMDCRSESLR